MFDWLNGFEQPVVQLTEADVIRCNEIVKRKIDYCKTYNQSHRYKIDGVKKAEPNFCGALGEQTIAHYFDYEYCYRDYDRNLYDILGYEIRTTYHANGRLFTHPKGVDKEGRYILVTVDKTTLCATIRGYSPLNRCNERLVNWDNTLQQPCWAMPQNQLWPIDMLPATPELIAHQMRLAA